MSSMHNPFEEMQNRQIRTFFTKEADRKIKAGVDSRIGAFRLLGNIADVYLKNMVDTMAGMVNGADESDQEEQIKPKRFNDDIDDVDIDDDTDDEEDSSRTDNDYPNL